MVGGGRTISCEFLSDKIKRLGEHGLSDAEEPAGTLKEAVCRVERHMISEALESSGGNQTKAAKILGLSRQGLLNKVAAYNIQVK